MKRARSVTVAIVGKSASKPESFVPRVREIISRDLRLDPANVTLVGTGSAFVEHLPVIMFLGGDFQALRIYGPSFDPRNDENPFQGRDGSLLNLSHQKMWEEREINSFDEIRAAIRRGAELINVEYFRKIDRISESNYLICISGAPENSNIWKKCKGVKISIQ